MLGKRIEASRVTRRRLLGAVGLGLAAAACSPLASPPAQPPVASTSAGAPTPTVPPLVGQLTRAQVEAAPGWETLRAQDYSPDAGAIAEIRRAAGGVDALLFVGTWCPDSKREVPRLFKVMDQAGWPESRLTIHGLDRTKKDSAGLADKWDVKYVPTFIFVKDGRELGRIIEKPGGTLEGDVARILASPVPLALSGSRPELASGAAGPTPSPRATPVEPATITVAEVKALLSGASPPPIFDARPKASYDAGHVPGAISLPLAELDKRVSEVPKDRLTIFYCSGST